MLLQAILLGRTAMRSREIGRRTSGTGKVRRERGGLDTESTRAVEDEGQGPGAWGAADGWQAL